VFRINRNIKKNNEMKKAPASLNLSSSLELNDSLRALLVHDAIATLTAPNRIFGLDIVLRSTLGICPHEYSADKRLSEKYNYWR